MARKQRKPQTELPPAWPSSPMRPPVHGFYFYMNGNFRGYHAFGASYSAKKFIELCLQGNDYEWVDGTRSGDGEAILDSTGLMIEGYGLEEVMDYEYTELEQAWSLTSPHDKEALQIRNRRLSLVPSISSDNDSAPRERKAKKEKVSRDGLITIQQIAGELKLEPSEARAILRKKKIEKPAAGWAWSKDDAEAIKKTLAASR